MPRLIAVLLASIAALAAAHAAVAAPYQDPFGRFSVDIPDGWETSKSEANADVLLIANVPREGADFIAICLTIYFDTRESRNSTQQELNDVVEKNLSEDFWNKTLTSSGERKTAIVSSGTRDQKGRRVAYAVYTSESTKEGKTFNSKGRMEIQFVPGSMHTLMCLADVKDYDAAYVGFEKLFTSYEPGNGAVVASATQEAPSVLTMYETVSYGGVARVIAQSTPDMAAAGWPTSGASLVVDGTEPWLVCERANFAGVCRTIDVAAAASPGRALAVGSAKRLEGQFDLKTLAATELRRAIHRARVHHATVR